MSIFWDMMRVYTFFVLYLIETWLIQKYIRTIWWRVSSIEIADEKEWPVIVFIEADGVIYSLLNGCPKFDSAKSHKNLTVRLIWLGNSNSHQTMSIKTLQFYYTRIELHIPWFLYWLSIKLYYSGEDGGGIMTQVLPEITSWRELLH